MSVVIKDMKTGKYRLLSKGADDVLMKRSISCECFTKENLQETINSYSKLGLRTMVLAYREIGQDEFTKLRDSVQSTNGMKPYRRFEELDNIYEQTEQNLTIIGATAVEDQLQDKVASTIEEFSKRNICLWMLTGDKLETAINVAYSSNLIKEQDNLIEVSNVADFSEGKNIKQLKKEVSVNFLKDLDNPDNFDMENPRMCMAISGEVLWVIINEPQYKEEFLEILQNLDIIIAARVTPGQKAELVKLVKENITNSRTLAIGDGFNDVNMIITSDVGVAINGKEDTQACRVADYSISEFKHLGPLVIHYGSDMYRRNSDYAQYNFYKNFLIAFPSIL